MRRVFYADIIDNFIGAAGLAISGDYVELKKVLNQYNSIYN